MMESSRAPRTLALGKPATAFYASIRGVLHAFGDVVWQDERALARPDDEVLHLVEARRIDQVLMPNPYGNEARLTCYRALRDRGVRVIASDRGALPHSWFFDEGFNADSPVYRPERWDHPLTTDQRERVRAYIEQLRRGDDSLEEQGARIGPAEIRRRLSLGDEKIVFVPLQRPNDTVVRYFSGAVGSLEELVRLAERTATLLGDGWRVLLKKHPLESDRIPVSNPNVSYVPDDMHVHDLIEASDAVLVLNSGVGLLSLMFGKPTIHVGEAFYGQPGLARRAESAEDAARMMRATSPDAEKVERFVHHLITRVYSFATFVTEKVQEKNGAYRRVTRDMKFRELRILGEEVPLPDRSVLVVSPVIPWPIYRGSQSRVDMTIQALIAANKRVSLIVLNQSVRVGNAEIVATLRERYPALDRVEVIRHPRLERNWRRDVFRLRRVVDFLSMDVHRVANADTCPPIFRRRVHRLVDDLQPEYLLINYAKLTPCIPDDYRGVTIVDTHDYQTKFLEEDQEQNGVRRWVVRDAFRKSEHEALRRYDRIIAISPLEKPVFEQIAPNARVYLAPAFSEQHESSETSAEPRWDALFVGSMSTFNVRGLQWFSQEVVPHILKARPSFRLAVAGNIDRSKLIDPGEHPRTELLGVVDDLAQCYRDSTVVVAPILGGAGMKIKVVEALGWGKAIVCTTRAAEGIDLRHGETAAVVDDPKEFASWVVRLCEDGELRARMGRAAAAFHAERHSPRAVAAAIAAVVSP